MREWVRMSKRERQRKIQRQKLDIMLCLVLLFFCRLALVGSIIVFIDFIDFRVGVRMIKG